MSEQLNRRVAKLEEKVSHLEHLNTPRQENEAPDGPHEAPDQESYSTPREAATVKVPPSPPNSDETKKPWYKTLQGWKAVAELVAIPFALGYAVVTYLQWKDLHHNFSIDERAWLQIRSKTDIKTAEDYTSPTQLLEVVNIGRSPATHVSIRSAGEILDNGREPSFDYTVTHFLFSMGVLYQNSPVDSRMGTLIDMTEGQRQDFTLGESYLAIYGIATFDDIFGVSHWTKFCVWRSFAETATSKAKATSSAKACIDYNSTDSQ